jgi:hypothetical protein
MAAEDVPSGVENLLLVVVGNEWPEADVGALRASATTWRDLAGQLSDLSVQAEAAAGYVDAGIAGSARQAFDAYLDSLLGQSGYLPGLESVCAGLADALEAMAVSVETLRNYIIEALVVLAAQIAVDVIAAPFTGGASMEEAAEAVVATRVLIMILARRLAAKVIAHFAAAELEQVGLTFLAELIEIFRHHQSGFDAAELRTAAINGGIGGAVGLGMGHLGGLLKAGGGKLAHDLTAGAPPAAGRVAPVVAGTIFDIGWGSASGTAEAAAQDAAAGSFGDEVAGAANGAFAGGKDRFHQAVNQADRFAISPMPYLEKGLLKVMGASGQPPGPPGSRPGTPPAELPSRPATPVPGQPPGPPGSRPGTPPAELPSRPATPVPGQSADPPQQGLLPPGEPVVLPPPGQLESPTREAADPGQQVTQRTDDLQ